MEIEDWIQRYIDLYNDRLLRSRGDVRNFFSRSGNLELDSNPQLEAAVLAEVGRNKGSYWLCQGEAVGIGWLFPKLSGLNSRSWSLLHSFFQAPSEFSADAEVELLRPACLKSPERGSWHLEELGELQFAGAGSSTNFSRATVPKAIAPLEAEADRPEALAAAISTMQQELSVLREDVRRSLEGGDKVREAIASLGELLQESTDDLRQEILRLRGEESFATSPAPPTFSQQTDEAGGTPPSVAVPLTVKEVVVRAKAKLKRLGWTREQGQKFLLERYGKQGTRQLNDEEWRDLHAYLLQIEHSKEKHESANEKTPSSESTFAFQETVASPAVRVNPPIERPPIPEAFLKDYNNRRGEAYAARQCLLNHNCWNVRAISKERVELTDGRPDNYWSIVADKRHTWLVPSLPCAQPQAEAIRNEGFFEIQAVQKPPTPSPQRLIVDKATLCKIVGNGQWQIVERGSLCGGEFA